MQCFYFAEKENKHCIILVRALQGPTAALLTNPGSQLRQKAH